MSLNRWPRPPIECNIDVPGGLLDMAAAAGAALVRQPVRRGAHCVEGRRPLRPAAAGAPLRALRTGRAWCVRSMLSLQNLGFEHRTLRPPACRSRGTSWCPAHKQGLVRAFDS